MLEIYIRCFWLVEKKMFGHWIDKLKAEDTGFSSRFIYDKVKPQHEYNTWFLISYKGWRYPLLLSSYCTQACLWVFASMINSISKYFTFKFPKRRLGSSACSVFSTLLGLKTVFSAPLGSNRPLQRPQISQLLSQSVLGRNDAKHAWKIPGHTVSVLSARSTSWRLGNCDREVGTGVQERVQYQALWVTRV